MLSRQLEEISKIQQCLSDLHIRLDYGLLYIFELKHNK